MTLGLSLHTHARVQGADGVRILKVLSPEEDAHTSLPPYWRATLCQGQINGGGEAPVQIDGVRDSAVIEPGDVIRLREGSGLVSVLWRRSARANSLFATERCNSLCLMCSQPPREEDDLWRVEEMLATIPLIDLEAQQLGITGGEPTLLGHHLTRVLDACGQHLPQTELHILTNGRAFKDPAAAAWTHAAGERAIWAVPLYADTAEVHDEVVGSPGAFDETLDGLYELAVNHARVEIRVVLHQLTVPRLGELAAYLYRRLPFVEHVALMGLEPMGFAKRHRDRLWVDPLDYLDPLRRAVFFLANRGMAVSIYNLPLCVLPRPLWPFARRSISEWKNSFASECEGCVVREHCSGFFASAGPTWRSRGVRTITARELPHELA